MATNTKMNLSSNYNKSACLLLGNNTFLILHTSANFSMPSLPQHTVLLLHVGFLYIIVCTNV